MQAIRTVALLLPLALVLSACATARSPLPDVPAGTYVLVQPESEVYNAVAITNRAFTARMGTQILSGEHWVSDGRLHMADFSGPCQGQESIWTYSYSNNRVTLDLVQDRCGARNPPFPQRMVYERR